MNNSDGKRIIRLIDGLFICRSGQLTYIWNKLNPSFPLEPGVPLFGIDFAED
jgi:hypothetical protein